MLRDKRALFTGLSLFLAFCISQAIAPVLALAGEDVRLALYAVMELGGFWLAALLLQRGAAPTPISLRLKKRVRGTMPFVLLFSLMLSSLAALLHYWTNRLMGTGEVPIDLPFSVTGWSLPVFLAVVLLPAAAEEVYLRGALLSSLEDNHSNRAALLIAALSSAMMRGSLVYLPGLLVLSLGLGYLVYSLDSLWPAIWGRVVYQLSCVAISLISRAYSAFGIWNYFGVLALVFSLLFGYFALRLLQRQLEKGRINHWQSGEQNALAAVLQTVLSPGFLAFVLAFISKAVLRLW